jgi:hypothetical protein
MRLSDLRAAAEILRAIVAKVHAGELRASTRDERARLEGAASALEAAASQRRARKR